MVSITFMFAPRVVKLKKDKYDIPTLRYRPVRYVIRTRSWGRLEIATVEIIRRKYLIKKLFKNIISIFII